MAAERAAARRPGTGSGLQASSSAPLLQASAGGAGRPSFTGLLVATAVCAILGFAAARYVGTRLAGLAFALHKINVHDRARALQVRAIRRIQWAYTVLGGIVDAAWPTLVIAIPTTAGGNPIGLIRGAPIVLLIVLSLIACGLMRWLGRAR